MSLVNISFDTKTKALDVNLDGVKQENISNISIYSYNSDEASIELTAVVGDEENQMYKRTCIYADHQETITEPVLDINKLSENLGKNLIR